MASPASCKLAQLAHFEFGFGDFAPGGVSQIKWLDRRGGTIERVVTTLGIF